MSAASSSPRRKGRDKASRATPPSKRADRLESGKGENKAGKLSPGLYLVATPIGNLGDITRRALEVLAAADRVLCEDTRVTAKLLQAYGLDATLQRYDDHATENQRDKVVAAIEGGAALALVSDAGAPLISDPGYKLVRACRAAGLAVTALPGPSAALTALQLSGLPSDRFLFAGFPPQKAGPRKAMLRELKDTPATLIFFEGPSRLGGSLADMAEILGDREAAVTRELTKLFEEVRTGRLSELAALYAGQPPRGEIAVVVGPPEGQGAEDADLEALLAGLLGALSLRDAVDRAAAETGLPRKQVYAVALELQKRPSGRDDG